MVQGQTNASEAFGKTGQPRSQLYRQAVQVMDRYAIGAWLFGGFVGLVIGAKLIQLSVRRRRTDYEPDRAACLSCGRCFSYCPVELDRRKKPKAAATDEVP
jgi:ferredoxin